MPEIDCERKKYAEAGRRVNVTPRPRLVTLHFENGEASRVESVND
ncbi:MAG: hypothetical protein CAPSK01_000300 [Candidatus Accumulibacter vicinus]|uniref:Uncharacterized protein n=1 Tax=Candidatus Accumulibacter vicinus TaxID=2954382 RepID=A0A084Y5B0_9PROT|nr:MAG: hypothetical protein CAPSK01_000300 [Candidatus Accumulibacter vicinus]